MEWLLTTLVFMALSVGFTYIIVQETLQKIKRQRDNALLEAKEFRNRYRDLQDINTVLIRRIDYLKAQAAETQVYSNIKLPPNTMKALQKAVFYSHPDKGGKAEDFMLCNQVYQEMKKRGYKQ